MYFDKAKIENLLYKLTLMTKLFQLRLLFLWLKTKLYKETAMEIWSLAFVPSGTEF